MHVMSLDALKLTWLQWRSPYRGKGGRVPPWQRKNCQKSGKRGKKSGKKRGKIRKKSRKRGKIRKKGKNREGSFTLPLLTNRTGYATAWLLCNLPASWPFFVSSGGYHIFSIVWLIQKFLSSAGLHHVHYINTITYFCNHCNISLIPMVIHQSMWIQELFFKNLTKGQWPQDDLWPCYCWGHMCDSTQGSLCPSPMKIHQSMWIQWPFFQKNLNQRSLTPRWPLTPTLLRSHVWLYPRIIVSKSHENTSKYVDTVTFLKKKKKKKTWSKIINP